MHTIFRPGLAVSVFGVLAIAACGGAGTTTSAPQTGGASLPAATVRQEATIRPGSDLEGLAPALLAPVFGASIPTPKCTDMSGGGRQCRWAAADGDLLVDADVQPEFATEQAWHDSFVGAGLDEEIPGIGVAALGGDNPLADGWRASAYTSDGLAYSVTVNKPGSDAEAKAIVIAILTALAS